MLSSYPAQSSRCPLDVAVQEMPHPPNSPSIKSISGQFKGKDAVGDQSKSLTEVQRWYSQSFPCPLLWPAKGCLWLQYISAWVSFFMHVSSGGNVWSRFRKQELAKWTCTCLPTAQVLLLSCCDSLQHLHAQIIVSATPGMKKYFLVLKTKVRGSKKNKTKTVWM